MIQLDSSAFVADPELVQALVQRGTMLDGAGERVLFQQGGPSTGLYVLLDGEATLLMESDAGNSILRLQAGAGSLLGLPGVVGEQPYSLTAIASAGARICFVSRAEFNCLMRSAPHLSIKMLQVLAEEVRSARRAFR